MENGEQHWVASPRPLALTMVSPLVNQAIAKLRLTMPPNPLFVRSNMCIRSLAILFLLGASVLIAQSPPMKPVRVADDRHGFALDDGTPFVAWGFNYDHDETGRLLEDYWTAEWPKVQEDFREMKDLGANVVRLHLQLGKFMRQPDEPNEPSRSTDSHAWSSWRNGCTCTST